MGPIGRQRELTAIEATVDGAALGPVGILVSGEPGIGKSVLFRAVVERFRARGWQVATANADILERQIPYAALARMVRPFVAEREPDIVTAAQDLVDVLDEVDASFGVVCARATALVQALLEGSGVVLAVDDLDALDDDSLALLAILVRRLPTTRLVLLGASRTEVPAPGSRLADLVRRVSDEATLHDVRLSALAPADLAEVVAPVLGSSPDEELAREVHRRAGGNPFFAREIASALRESGTLEIDADSARLAPGAEVLRVTPQGALVDRVTPFEPDMRQVLEAVAVLGRPGTPELALLARMTGLDQDRIARSLDDLVAAGVLAHTAGTWAFTHDLVREAVYDGIGPARQHLLHRSVADALVEERAAGRRVDLLALARHVSLVAEAGDPIAARILTEAADLTRGVAPRSSAGLYERALDVLPVGDPVRGEVLARRARALSLAGNPADSAEVGRQALQLLTAGTERARTALVVINALVELGRLDDALLIADAEVATTRTPTLVVERARVLWFLGRQEEALVEAQEADLMASASPSERCLVLGPLSLFAASTHRPRPVPELAEEMMSLADKLPPTLGIYARVVASYALATCGYVRLARPALEEAEALLDEVGGSAFRSNLLVARVFLDWLEGRWDEAVEGTAAALVELEGANFAVQASGLHAIELAIRSARGEGIRNELLHERAPAPNFADLQAWAVAGALLAADRLDEARAALDGATSRGEQGIAYYPLLLARRVEVELRAGDEGAAVAALSRLEDEDASRPHPWGSVLLHHCRALVHRDPTEAVTAARLADEGGFVAERALAQLTVAELDAGAGDALQDAYRSFQALGADPWRRRAGTLMRDRDMAVPRQRATRSGLLTDAETKIARLVQEGMRNREIATVLHYSPRTVEVYLSRIYAKLGVSSRLELARTLDQRSS